MRIRVFCIAVGVMAAGTWAQVPIFKLWVTEVYEVNPDGSYTAKCDVYCPTQDLPGIARPGDLINVEVTVEGWDASTDSGNCDPAGEACSVSAQDCALSHCSGNQTREPCSEDSECLFPDTCDPDSCEKSPLVGGFQWTIDSSTYSNGGPGPGFAPAELACTKDADCACLFTEIPGVFNDCADHTFINPDFCTCAQATCDENVCDPWAVAYIDSSPVTNFIFANCQFLPLITVVIPDYEIGVICLDANAGGVPEELFRCTVGARPICNVDADCPSGTCELAATSPYYLGTLLLEVTGQSCGLFTLDLGQRLIDNVAVETFLVADGGAHLPNPIVEPLIIDLGVPIACDDDDPCTQNDASCGGGECMGTPVGCDPGPTCVSGKCVDCCMVTLTDATWADAGPLASNPFDRPGNCAIDARQPHWINDGNAKQGWDRLVLEFSGDPTDLAATLRPERFLVQTDPVEASPPAIPLDGIVSDAIDRTITIHLDRRISPGFYTCILHIDSGNHWCAGFLPADTNLNGLSAAHDILALIDAMNLPSVHGLPIYATDMNRGAVTTGADIIRLIDLLNGAGAFDAWIARSLPDCPSAP